MSYISNYEKEKICAVIVAYNSGVEIFETINSVINKVNEVIIVDNGSSYENKEILKGFIKDTSAHIIFNDINLGIATALNIGANYALDKGYEWMLTLDDDSKVTASMLNTMFECYWQFSEEVKEKIAVIAPKHIEKYTEFNENATNQSNEKNVFTKVNTEITSGNLVKLEILKSTGLYNEKFFIDFVDHFFCLNLSRNGYDVVRVENAILIHNLGISVPKNFLGKKITVTNHSYLRRYYMTRNRLYTWQEFKTFCPEWVREDRFRFINEFIKIVLFENDKILKLKMIIKGIKDYKNHVYGKYE